MSDPIADKIIDVSKDAPQREQAEPAKEEAGTEVAAAKPEEKPGQFKLQQLPPETLQKLGDNTDKLLCVLVTLVGRKTSGDDTFKLTRAEIAESEFGKSVWQLINWYLPQLPVDHPAIPLVLASVGVGTVVASKWPTKKEKAAEQRAELEQAAPPTEPEPEQPEGEDERAS